MSKYKDGSYIVKDGVIYEVQIDFFKYSNVTAIPVSDFMKKTNADRIRTMTDEELAHELATRFSTDCNCCPAVNDCPVWLADLDTECEDSFLKWLKEAEE